MDRPSRITSLKTLHTIERRLVDDPDHSVLTLCARPSMPENLVPELERRVRRVREWETELSLAEEHGLGPLLHTHLVVAGIETAPLVRRKLKGLYVRHRRLNDVLFQNLADILDRLDEAGIAVRVLKGPALAALVYREPGLRPTSDLDLLVSEPDAMRTQRLLGEMGFSIRLPATQYRLRRDHHLPVAVRSVDGVPILVEVHHQVLESDRWGASQFRELSGDPLVFDVATRQAPTLELHELLGHLCRHLTGVARHPFRLVWVSDIIGVTETFGDQLDWDYLRQSYPYVLGTLSALHALTPVPDEVLRLGRVPLEPSPRQVAVDYTGWPRATALVWDGLRGRLDFLTRTLNPPIWWLRLTYGTGGQRGGRWAGRLFHLAALLRIIGRRLGDLLPRRSRDPDHP